MKKENKMERPTIQMVARDLRQINRNVECDDDGCDVRLQVWDNGAWALRTGSSDYDQDHRGYWGASFVPGVVNGTVRRFNSVDIARDLIDQVEDHHAQSAS